MEYCIVSLVSIHAAWKLNRSLLFWPAWALAHNIIIYIWNLLYQPLEILYMDTYTQEWVLAQDTVVVLILQLVMGNFI